MSSQEKEGARSGLGLRRSAWRSPAVAAIALFAWGFIASSASVANSTWLDVEGRIQYGYYTEDTRTLESVAEQLAVADGNDGPLKQYYSALANYRLASLWASRDKARARGAVEKCVQSLDAALAKQTNFAEGFALQAACLRTVATLAPWKPLAASRSSGQMERATRLAPKDPRVLLLKALEKGETAKIDEAGLATLKKATAAFEAERQGVDRTPGWGAAEAYAHLGQGYLERGDVLAARDALERALLIAPDFALVKRILTRITSG